MSTDLVGSVAGPPAVADDQIRLWVAAAAVRVNSDPGNMDPRLAAAAAIVGAALTVWGFYLAWPPLAFIAAGTLLIAAGLLLDIGD